MDVIAHPSFDAELTSLRSSDRGSAQAIEHAIHVLVSADGTLGYPWTSAVRSAPGIRELRPRSGRSRHRLLFRRAGDHVDLLALAPEATSDPRGFARAVRRATERARSLDRGTT